MLPLAQNAHGAEGGDAHGGGVGAVGATGGAHGAGASQPQGLAGVAVDFHQLRGPGQLLHGGEAHEGPQGAAGVGRLHLVADGTHLFHSGVPLLVGVEPDADIHAAGGGDGVDAGAAGDLAAVEGHMVEVRQVLDGHHLAGGLPDGAGALFRGGAAVAGDARHIQADDAAALTAGDKGAVRQAAFKGEGGAAALGVGLQELHGRHAGEGVTGLLVADGHQLELAAVVAGVLQCADHIQGDHQSALAVVDAGTVDGVALHPPRAAGEAAHGMDRIHMAQQQNRRQRLGRRPGSQARAGTLRAELFRLHAKGTAVGVQMAGQQVNGGRVGAGGLHFHQCLPQKQHLIVILIQIMQGVFQLCHCALLLCRKYGAILARIRLPVIHVFPFV